MTSFADVLAKAKPARRTVRICVDGAALDDLRRAVDAGDEDAAAEARTRAEAADVQFELMAVSSYAWNDLVSAHTAQQGEPVVDLGVGSSSFPPGILIVGRGFIAAAIAACLVEPKATADEAQQFLDALPQGIVGQLIEAVLAINGDTGEIPKSVRRSDGTNNSDERPSTSAPAESPGASSTEEPSAALNLSGSRRTAGSRSPGKPSTTNDAPTAGN